MSRRRIINDSKEEMIEDAQVVMRWSGKRIVIATTLVIMTILGGIYAISLLSQNPKVLGEKTVSEAQIKLPDEEGIQEIIDKAKQDLSDVNAKNLIESQPRIKKIIDDLTNLTGSSNSAKSLICDNLCK